MSSSGVSSTDPQPGASSQGTGQTATTQTRLIEAMTVAYGDAFMNLTINAEAL